MDFGLWHDSSKCTEIQKGQSAHYGDYLARYVPVGPA